MLDIKGSVAVITGGGGGIGFSIAKYWVKNSGKVVIADISEELLKKAEADLKAMGGEVTSVACNVTNEDDCARLADTAIETFGQINLVAPFAGIIKDGMMVSPDRETGKVGKKDGPGRFQAGRRHQPDRRLPDRTRMRREDDQPQLPRPDMPRLLHRLPRHRGPA